MLDGDIKYSRPPYRLFGDAILLCNSSREEMERKLCGMEKGNG